jgi:hypothetical protein
MVDTIKLEQTLESLKDMARTYCDEMPEFLRFETNHVYKRAWLRLRRIEDQIVGEAFIRDIKLKLDYGTVRFREMYKLEKDLRTVWEIYLDGKYVEPNVEGLEKFILLHRKWNQYLITILNEKLIDL